MKRIPAQCRYACGNGVRSIPFSARVPEEYGFIFVKDNAVLGRKEFVIGCDGNALQRILPMIGVFYVRYGIGKVFVNNLPRYVSDVSL